jgi:hypothetical protein
MSKRKRKPEGERALMDEPTEGIRWPAEFAPERAPIHVRNEVAVLAPAATVWAWLIRARNWPTWYPNCHDVHIGNGLADLSPNVTFRWRTFGVSLFSQVEEFIPVERIAWNARGNGVWAYHAWLLRPNSGGCTVVTEETQYGFLARMGRLLMPSRMHRFHQVWLEGLKEKAQNGVPQT